MPAISPDRRDAFLAHVAFFTSILNSATRDDETSTTEGIHLLATRMCTKSHAELTESRSGGGGGFTFFGIFGADGGGSATNIHKLNTLYHGGYRDEAIKLAKAAIHHRRTGVPAITPTIMSQLIEAYNFGLSFILGADDSRPDGGGGDEHRPNYPVVVNGYAQNLPIESAKIHLGELPTSRCEVTGNTLMCTMTNSSHNSGFRVAVPVIPNRQAQMKITATSTTPAYLFAKTGGGRDDRFTPPHDLLWAGQTEGFGNHPIELAQTFTPTTTPVYVGALWAQATANANSSMTITAISVTQN